MGHLINGFELLAAGLAADLAHVLRYGFCTDRNWRCLQGPFTLDHLKLLAEDSIIGSDTIVLHAVHGSALLSSVLATPAPSEPAFSKQEVTGPSADNR